MYFRRIVNHRPQEERSPTLTTSWLIWFDQKACWHEWGLSHLNQLKQYTLIAIRREDVLNTICHLLLCYSKFIKSIHVVVQALSQTNSPCLILHWLSNRLEKSHGSSNERVFSATTRCIITSTPISLSHFHLENSSLSGCKDTVTGHAPFNLKLHKMAGNDWSENLQPNAKSTQKGFHPPIQQQQKKWQQYSMI